MSANARIKAALAVAALVVVPAVTAACGSSGSGGSKTNSGSATTAKVVASQDSDWQTMDHQVNTPGLMWWETGGYDRLTAVFNGKVVPYLASSWKVASDNKSVIFTLRRGIKCQDGTTLTPSDVAASFTRLFTVVKKGDNLASDFGSGPLSASANNKNSTVTISTKTAFAGLLTGAASGEASVICPAGLAHSARLQTGLYGSGPYELVSAVHGSQVALKRNPHWTWGPVVNGKQVTWKDLPAKQTWQITTDPSTLQNDLLTGSVQVGRFNNGPQVVQLSKNKAFKVTAVPLNFPLVVSFQEGAGHATNDPALRHALSVLVNAGNLNKAFNQGGKLSPLVTSFVQPWQQCYDAKTKSLYPTGSTATAKQILTKAGYKGFGTKLVAPDGTPVTLRIVTSPGLSGNAGPYLQQAFSPLGANVQLTNTNDIAALTSKVYGGQQDVGVSTGQASDPALTNSIIAYYAGPSIGQGGLNVYGPPQSEDPKWTELVGTALGSSGCATWDQVQEYALTHYIMLPIAQANWYNVSRNSVKVSTGYFAYEPWTIRAAG